MAIPTEALTSLVGGLLGWIGRSVRHRNRTNRELAKIRKVLERLDGDVMSLAISLWQGRGHGRRWHDRNR